MPAGARLALVVAFVATFLFACSDDGGNSTCASPLLRCGDRCVDPATDPAHCGACDTACDEGGFCVAGACALGCPAPLAVCDDRCVELETDPAHCGGCGTACDANQFCAAGTCRTHCAEGETLCGDACVTLATDPAHCGACGNACRADQACADGGCGCANGATECDGACVQLASDPSNCGACGVACADGLVCRAGACGAPACTGELLLPGLPSVDAGGIVYGATTADVDGDGDLDLAFSVSLSTELRWLENEDGRLVGPYRVLVELGQGLLDLHAVDLDGAGPIDFVGAPTSPDDTIAFVLRGAGGSVTVKRLALPGMGLASSAPADLDGDGDLDLAVYGGSGDERGLHFVENRGAGDFAWQGTPIPANDYLGLVAAGDLDGDGATDLALAVVPLHRLAVFVRDGPFHFVARPLVDTRFRGLSLELADLDRDGDADVVMEAGTLLANDGTGTFSAWSPEPAAALMGRATVGDIDGDGDLDVVGDRPGDSAIEVLRNEGGVFPAVETYFAASGQEAPMLADLDGDGTLDLVMAGTERWVDVLPNREGGRFPSLYRDLEELGTRPAVAVGSLLGSPIAAVVADAPPRMIVFSGSESGFARSYSWLLDTAYRGAASGDLDRDGSLEVLSIRNDTGAVEVVLSWTVAGGPIAGSGHALAAAIADADGDGWEDVVTIEAEPEPALRILPNRAFAAPVTHPLVGLPRAFTAGDLDGDGDSDFAIATDRWLQVVLGDTAGPSTAEVLEVTADELASGDVDGDGRAELVTVEAQESRLRVYRYTGTALEVMGTVEDLWGLTDLAVADLDLDGFGDVLGADSATGVIRVYSGGPGLFATQRAWPALITWTSLNQGQVVRVADFDLDLRPDVLVVESKGVAALLGRCAEGPAAASGR